MKYLKIWITVAFIALVPFIASCSKTKTPLSEINTDNTAIVVDQLFTYKGITIFRFTDSGRSVYFTIPSTDIKAVSTESCGKNCSYAVTTETLSR